MENTEQKQEVIGYIGDRGILSFDVVGDGSFVMVKFVEGYETKMSGTLFFALKTDEKGQGSVTDGINHYFATRFLAELAMNGLEYYFVDNVGTSMRVLAHNLREELIKRTFNCSGGDAIALETLLS